MQFKSYIYGCLIAFSIIMSATKVCTGCKLEKVVAEEFKLAPGGLYYENCNKCFIANTLLFWQNKTFKVCKDCKDKKHLEDYRRDRNECPWPNCKSCYAETVLLQHRQKRFVGEKKA